MLMKHVLITGAAGFIGFHLAKALKKRGDHVIGVDNFNDYYDPLLKRARAKEVEKQGIALLEGDITDANFLYELIAHHQISHLVHLAAQAGVRYSLENPQAYVKANIEGFLNVLETCRQFPGLQLVYASSSSVYGLNQKIPFSIEDRTDHQASLYGVTKKANELMASTYYHLYQIPITGLRFFTVYGPWGRPDMAYFQFTKSILEGKPIHIFNHGKMRRDFTYIDDIVQGIESSIDRKGKNEIFNLGNHQPVDLLKMVEIIEESIGKKAEKIFVPMQPGDVLETYADIQVSQQILGFLPKTTLEEGIPQFVKWYLNYWATKTA
ncbi:UDP-glucuronate 4-epimerase 4 [Neochlamydia sp. AcF65]|nr:UDP-glucuronate 4-epimerase 4 [Neochlamydia sp. AcF65]